MMYVVKTGIVKAYSVLSNGSEVIITLFGQGDYFPLSLDADNTTVALFYYEMMCDGELERYSFDEFNDYLQQAMSQSIKAERRYLGALLHISALAQVNAQEKLAHTMRYLALRFGEALSGGVYTRIGLKLTQQDIASLSNLSRETTNIELSKLKSLNIVVVRAKLYSVNLRMINKMIGDDIGQNIKI